MIPSNTHLLCLFFGFLIQVPSVQTIACYTCIDCGDPFDLVQSNVSQSLPVCAYCYKLTVFMAYAPSRYVVKECVRSCTEAGYSFGGSSLQVNCCTSSFCNHVVGMKILIDTFLLIVCLFVSFAWRSTK